MCAEYRREWGINSYGFNQESKNEKKTDLTHFNSVFGIFSPPSSSHRLNRFNFIFKLLSCFFHSVFIFRLGFFFLFAWDSRILLFCRQFAFPNVNLIVGIPSSCLSSIRKCVKKGAHCKSIEGIDEGEREEKM